MYTDKWLNTCLQACHMPRTQLTLVIIITISSGIIFNKWQYQSTIKTEAQMWRYTMLAQLLMTVQILQPLLILMPLQILRCIGLCNLVVCYRDLKYSPSSLNVLQLFANILFLSLSLFSPFPPIFHCSLCSLNYSHICHIHHSPAVFLFVPMSSMAHVST